ncbi:NERD domain-containing protein [Jeotgalibacillus soli]|uniref:NERD domain-containing protein n=1 Tax=Jeotgalibacillus soli TaxID=889306 RepID=A0A0C2R0Q6_9BACL|nr:NERD domain-containing protein [Jeotgalibacillus soli]KIL43900.1 hypothetical protein KP78_37240 [Jeotgalibacillus soli]
MAQLIKLQDYVSRYEKDMVRYPSQFVRLKKQQWEKIKKQWDEGSVFMNTDEVQHFKEEIEGKEGLFTRFRKILTRDHAREEQEVDFEGDQEMSLEEPQFDFEPQVYYRPETLDELKHMYLDQLYQFQLKWASSTLTEKSYVDSKFLREETLRYLLQRFPDTYLVLYEPIVKLKKAPIELEILLLTPTHIWCLMFLEESDQAAYIGSMDRFWTVKSGEQEKRILNPSISLDRMESILKQIFQQDEVDFPIKKALISRDGYIDFPDYPYGLTLLDRKSYPEWFMQQRSSRSPLKHMQIKAAKAILSRTQTTSVSQMQWNMKDDDQAVLQEPLE